MMRQAWGCTAWKKHPLQWISKVLKSAADLRVIHNLKGAFGESGPRWLGFNCELSDIVKVRLSPNLSTRLEMPSNVQRMFDFESSTHFQGGARSKNLGHY